MKRLDTRALFALLTGGLFAYAVAAEPVAIEPEERYHAILNELRCLVCQNQTIAESDADLAKDLRAEVKTMLAQGASDTDIIDFMANRYGDFVLYKPRIKPKTYLLWFGPFILLAVALTILIVIVTRQKRSQRARLSAHEQARLGSILEQTED